MAYDPDTDSLWPAGFTVASHIVGFETSDGGDPVLVGLSDTEASGDWRKLMYHMAEAFWQAYNSLATADKPTKMRMFRGTSNNDAAGTVTRTYTLSFDVDEGDVEVTSE